MRILIVTHYWRPHTGGIENVAWEQARRFVALGHKVTVVTSRLSGDPELSSDDGFPVYRVKVLNFLESRGIPYPIFSLRLPFLLRRLVFEHDVVLGHSHTFLPSVFATIISRWLKCPVVILQHNTYIDYRFPWNILQRLADRTLGQITLRLASRCLAVSTESQAYISQLVSNRDVSILHNGVDVGRFRPAMCRDEKKQLRQTLGLPVDGFLVLTVRRIVFKNGLDDLVAAAERLRMAGDIHFLIGGGGPDWRIVKSMIHSKKLTNISLLGFLPGRLLPEYYRAADIFVLPSTSGEGFPLVVLEAFASGLPVVATRAGGQVDIVLEGMTGHLVAPGNSERLASAVEQCFREKERTLIMGRQARRSADSLSWERQVEALVTHLKEVCDGLAG